MQMLRRNNTENSLFSTPGDLNNNISNLPEISFKVMLQDTWENIHPALKNSRKLLQARCASKNIAEGENPFTFNITTFGFAV